MRIPKILWATLLSLALVSCGRKDTAPTSGNAAQKATNEAVINHVAKNVIMRTYLDLASSARNLEDQIRILALQPSEQNLNAAQDAWRATRVFWESSEAFIFGPVADLGIDPTIDTWPLNILDLQGVLATKSPLTVGFVRNLGSNLQGFHTIEYLLFGDGHAGPVKDFNTLTSRQLDYLKACSALLSEYTQKIADAWLKNANPDDPSVPGFITIIGEPNLNNPIYQSHVAVFNELALHMIAIIDEVANGKMSDPLGADLASADVSLVESPFSWNSLTDFTNNIRSVLMVYTGEYMGSTGPGLYEVIAAKDPGVAALVLQRIRESVQKIQDIKGPEGLNFRQAIQQPAGRVRVQEAINSLNSLRSLFEQSVLPLVRE